MKVFKQAGSKDRLMEMFQNINKVNLNENILDAATRSGNLVKDAFNELKNNQMKIENTETLVEGDDSFIEVTATQEGNTYTFKFKVVGNEGDQDNVYSVTDAKIIKFNAELTNPTRASIEAEEGVNTVDKLNNEQKSDIIEFVSQFVDFEDQNIPDELYEDAVKLIDKVPYKVGSEQMVKHQEYADEKPTNSKVRVDAEELKKFVKEDFEDFQDDDDFAPLSDVDDEEDEPMDEPEMDNEPVEEISDEKKKTIWQAHDNVIARSGDPNYAPTMDEIMDEVDRLEGVVKPPKKKVNVYPKEAEPFLEEELEGEKKLAHQITVPEVSEKQRELILQAYDIVKTGKPEGYVPTLEEVMGQIQEMLQSLNMNEDFRSDQNARMNQMRQEIVFRAKETVDARLAMEGRTDISLFEYREMIVEEANKIFNEIRMASMNENDYPKEMGKEFAPDSDYPGKKKKYKSKKVKIKEEEEVMDGEKQIKRKYVALNSDMDFGKLAAAYQGLLKLRHGDFRSTDVVQKALSALRDAITNYLNQVKGLSVSEEDVQNYFQNSMTRRFPSMTEAEYPEVDDLDVSEPEVDDIEVSKPESEENDGMSLEPKGDEVAQIAQDKEEAGDALEGGLADGKSPLEFDPEQILMGIEVEMEHTDDPLVAVEIAMDHLTEDPEYYTRKDDPEASAQDGAAKDAEGEEEKPDVEKENPDLYPDGWKEMDGMFMSPNSPMHKGAEGDKELTDELLGYKPKNVGEEFDFAASEREYTDKDAYNRYLEMDKMDFNSLSDDEKEEFFELWKQFKGAEKVNEASTKYAVVFDGTSAFVEDENEIPEFAEVMGRFENIDDAQARADEINAEAGNISEQQIKLARQALNKRGLNEGMTKKEAVLLLIKKNIKY